MTKCRKGHIAFYAIILVVSLLGLFTIGVQFEPVTRDSIVDWAIPLLFFAVIIERVLEVIMTPWTPSASAKAKLKDAVGDKEKALEAIAKESKSLLTEDAKKERGELLMKKDELTDLKSDTQKWAFRVSFSIGVIFAVLGVRALEPWLILKGIGEFQQNILTFVDVIFTGALLSGGADGIHQPVRAVLDGIEKYKR